jgi:hypothetical protein
MENLLAFPWLFVVAGGALVLAIAIAYGMNRTRRLSRSELRRTDAGSREIYDKDEHGERV